MFKREFKVNMKSLILWTSILIAFFLVVFLVYPSIMDSENTKQIKGFMEAFPKEMLEMFNMDIIGIETAFGWLKTEGYVFLTLLGGIYAATLGGTILVKEEGDKTIEFLATKPISRNKIITSKIACGICNITIFTVAIAIFNFIGLSLIEEVQIKELLLITLSPLLLYFMLFFICMFISTFLKKTRLSMTISIGVTFLAYLMQILGGMSENINFIKQASLFEFVSARYITIHNSMNLGYLGIGIGIIVVAAIAIYIRYNKKELVV